jgi:hypothetical protein
VVTQDDVSLMEDLLNGEFVRAVRVAAFSGLMQGASLRQSNPAEADMLFVSACRLEANANEIEWLTARYVHLGEEAEFWGRFAKSVDSFVASAVNRINYP